jgi:hypothetical protein
MTPVTVTARDVQVPLKADTVVLSAGWPILAGQLLA